MTQSGRPVKSARDHPRPPAVVRCELTEHPHFDGVGIASSTQSLRVLETSTSDVLPAHSEPCPGCCSQ